MPERYVDRGSLLNGQDRTSRDSRVPFSYPRAIENYSLPDKRARRRIGYASVHEHVRTQALAKHTGVTISKRAQESAHNKGTFLVTPLSYGVIKWQEKFQLRTTKDTTIEFCLRLGDEEELVKNPFTRLAHYETGGSPTPASGWSNWQLRTPGVFVYDQTLLSTNHKMELAVVTKAGVATPSGTVYDLDSYRVSTANNFDVFPLTTFAIGFTSTQIFCELTLVDTSTGNYWRTEGMAYALPSYTAGDIYHVAVRTESSSRRFRLYINGVSVDTFTIPAGFAYVGEWDLINKITYTSGQKRDIVLLNECTARASYQSACKFDTYNHGFQTFHHGFGATSGTTGLVPWACSPPRGTAMWDLRIWDEPRASGDILAYSKKRILITDSNPNLVGNWHLNDGGPVCKNHVSGSERLYCSIHHGYPGYVDHSELLHGIGIKLGDGQHIIKSFGESDRDLGIGIADKIGNVFAFQAGATGTMEHQEINDFTVQIQFTVPDALQVELNDQDATATGGAATQYYDVLAVEARRPIYSVLANAYNLKDGSVDNYAGTSSRRTCLYFIRSIAGCTMAFDQTLWSIEGTQNKESQLTAGNLCNEPDRRRIPVARGLLTPSGRIAFELGKEDYGGSQPYIVRVLSNTTLTVGHVYTVTFVQRSRHVWTGGATQTLNAYGWDAEIWIEDITAGTPAAKDSGSFTVTTEGGAYATSYSYPHRGNYDIIIGSSYVNDGWDWGINAGKVVTQYTSYQPTGGAHRRGNHGPWPVSQHFMNPYQDQPLNAVVGFFRLWSTAITNQSIARYGSTSIKQEGYSADLLVNLEFDAITGIEIPNRCRYPDSFTLGYKGWGEPQGHATSTWDVFSDTLLYFPNRWYDAPWAFEDCLGYIPIDSESYNARQAYTTVRGIMPMKSSYAEQYGVVSVYDSASAFDEDLSGVFQPMFLSGHGLMSELIPNQDWFGTVVGDRLIMTSAAALPKVFDGRKATVAGFKKWTGGIPLAYPNSAGPGSLTSSKWYGVCVVYWAEETGLYHVSPVVAMYLGASDDTATLFNIPQHPDPRVTVVEFYRTAPQETEELALYAPLYKTRVRTPTYGNSNSPYRYMSFTEADSALSGAILSRDVTEMPMCKFSAALNDTLYLAGDPANPDVVYFTDAGNPERIDKLANSLEIPEGSGDAVTGMVSAFGAIFIFKPNAIWRLDDLGGGQHQFTKLNGIGAVSQKAISLIVDPDTGATLIFFWSYHGPYLFDGASCRYIGSAIEESTVDGSSAAQYNWLDPLSVVVAHNAVAREIICIYSPKVTISSVVTSFDRACKAVVFNYRAASWVTFTGLPGACALSLSYTITNIGTAVRQQDIEYLLFIGSVNGKIFKWGGSKYDGSPLGFTPLANKAVLSRPAAGRFVITDLTITATEDLLDCWVAFVDKATGNWIVCPIIATDVAGNYIEVDTTFYVGGPFDPDTSTLTDLYAYLCQPPASVEFPWDELDVPFYDKKIVQLITWHNAAHYFKLLLNYDSSVVAAEWTLLADSSSQRKRTTILKGKCEAAKLHLMSFELDAAIDAIAYLTAYDGKGVTPQ